MTNPLDPQQPSAAMPALKGSVREGDLDILFMRDRSITEKMGGGLVEQPDPTRFRHILDVGCGTGGWLIEMAHTSLPTTRLVGIDKREQMIDYARTQATAQHVNDRVRFEVMNTSILDFPEASFDLVHQRLGARDLRAWDWPDLLRMFERILMPGGVIRLTESESMESTSLALTQLTNLFLQALDQSGHVSLDGKKIENELVRLLKQLEIQNIQTRGSILELRRDTPEGQYYYEDMRQALRMFQPFVLKWVRVADYDVLCKQALEDMQRSDFVGTWKLITVWGSKRK